MRSARDGDAYPERDASIDELLDQAVDQIREVLERRREVLARLRAQGVLVVETTPGTVKTDAINEYLEVKARGLV